MVRAFAAQEVEKDHAFMSDQSLAALLEAIRHTRYHAEWKVLAWHPRGVLDDPLADEVIRLLEAHESLTDEPFDRYLDFSGLTQVQLTLSHMFQIAEQRQAAPEPVKSAIFAEKTVGLGIAWMYEALMRGATLQVRVFQDRESAAEWLGVPLQILMPEGP